MSVRLENFGLRQLKIFRLFGTENYKMKKVASGAGKPENYSRTIMVYSDHRMFY